MSKLKIVNDVCFFSGKRKDYTCSKITILALSNDPHNYFSTLVSFVSLEKKPLSTKFFKASWKFTKNLKFFSYGSGYDLAARRKNATRESTATLKAWLNEHKKNPYPTKGEKIMLAIITKMTLTQVRSLAGLLCSWDQGIFPMISFNSLISLCIYFMIRMATLG